jgi:hypothetical protein
MKAVKGNLFRSAHLLVEQNKTWVPTGIKIAIHLGAL